VQHSGGRDIIAHADERSPFFRKPTMPHSLTLELEVPDDLAQLRLPPALNDRLQKLLDRQDSGMPLSPQEALEAEGLVNLAEFLTLLRLRAERGGNGHGAT
jgi:hypothetical protein